MEQRDEMAVTERKYMEKDDPKAIEHLKKGRDALIKRDYSKAMRSFHKCYKSRITKELAALLLNQMANCMDELEYYDQQQTFLEELCELESTFENFNKLLNIYQETNNEIKLKELASKINSLAPTDGEEAERAISLLSNVKDFPEVIRRCVKWLEEHPGDESISKTVLNAYLENKDIKDAWDFADGLIKSGKKDKYLMELSSLARQVYDFEGSRDYMLRHFEIHEDNEYGVNKLAHTFITNASYHGTLNGDDYVYWMERAVEGTKPAKVNSYFDRDTNLFRKIRIGFVSYDFRMHSVGKFILSLFDEISNNTGIETYCYYTYPDYEDEFTAVFKERADVFKSVGRYSNKQLRKELLDDKLDIIVDLNGQTVGNKLSLLAERFAPIQITWMGFPFSSFYHNIDYIIGDYNFDPVDGETGEYCSEEVLRMDPCYMCFAMAADIYAAPEPPQTANGYITFGMVNNPNKYSEESIRLWQSCLEAVPGSRLMMQLSNYPGEFAEKKFVERLEKFGLDMSRVDLGRDYGQAGYYETYNKVDVMLDSVPFGGGTTTPEAIWMGVPVIGVQYHMRHGRMAYDFMTQVGLGHLCADSVDTYVEKVRKVSKNVDLLRDLRRNLRGRLKDMPLFDTRVFREAFENAMRDAFIDFCMDNKKPFKAEYYKDKDGVLLKDCVRAADIIGIELTRGRKADKRKMSALLREYVEIHRYLLVRFSKIYKDNVGVLKIALNISEMLDVTEKTNDLSVIAAVVQTIRNMLIKFA